MTEKKTLTGWVRVVRQHETPATPPTFLAPGQEFPPSLVELELPVLQVLHSRVCRQLEREHLDPDGPHPETLDRQQALLVELDIREENAR